MSGRSWGSVCECGRGGASGLALASCRVVPWPGLEEQHADGVDDGF